MQNELFCNKMGKGLFFNINANNLSFKNHATFRNFHTKT